MERQNYQFLENYEAWLNSLGMSADFAQFLKILSVLAAVLALAIVSNYIAKRIIVSGFVKFAAKTQNTWDDKILERGVVQKLSHLAPAMVLQATIGIVFYDYSPKITVFLENLTYIYIIATWMAVIFAFLSAIHDIYIELQVAKTRPIKGYLQLVKIIVTILGGILIVSVLINKDPRSLLMGMGASAAILMLVFRDSILGLVASIQVSANNMVKPGDWIVMPNRGADGPVLEISLNTVKVQNWDKTIATIPTYALVSESFTNWKGMEDGPDGRRIKRSIFIDVKSVKFCPPQLIRKLKKIHLLKDYVAQREKEIAEHNKKHKYDSTIKVNGRRMTNLGMFRHYVEHYIRNNPDINVNATNMVRHLQPTEHGIPLEVYCFCKQKQWVKYEQVQSDLFDHILTVVPEFELRLFQNPTGEDFAKLK